MDFWKLLERLVQAVPDAITYFSCLAAMHYAGAPVRTEAEMARISFIADFIFLVPPLLTLIGMAVWARQTYVASRQISAADEAAQEKDPSVG